MKPHFITDLMHTQAFLYLVISFIKIIHWSSWVICFNKLTQLYKEETIIKILKKTMKPILQAGGYW